MSYSKRSRISAYQVYSSHQSHSKSSRHSQSYNSDSSHDNHSDKYIQHTAGFKRDKSSVSISSRGLHRHKGKVYDSDEEVLKGYTPKCLLESALSKDRSSDKHKMLEHSSRKESIRERHMEDYKKPSTRSLMDIDFSIGHSSVSGKNLSKWKDISSHRGYSSGEESHNHLDGRGDWKSGRRYSKYSDSEEDGDVWHSASKSRRSWKNSSSAAQHSGHTSRPSALIVEMTEGSNNSVQRRLSGDNSSKPKPLLETYIPPPVKKPISLLDLANSNDRNVSRFKRKSGHRSIQSSSDRKTLTHTTTNSDKKPDQDSSASSRKRTAPEVNQEQLVKKPKIVKPKSDAKDKVAVVDAGKISVCKTSGSTFLVIPSPLTTMHLHGRGKITVLMGSISIMGCKLRVGSTYDVYSPASGSLLAMQANDTTKFKAADVKEELSKFNIQENDKDLENVGNNTIAVLMVDYLESAMCDYVTSFIPYTQLFTAMSSRDLDPSILKGITLLKLGLKVSPMKEMVPACMNISPDYENALMKWTKLLSGDTANKSPVILCCGAKNVGKSTFNRMLINTALKSVGVVAYLECDVGQTEFSPPATLSLHILKQPILEPPFCHQKHATKMVFYGETTPSYDPSLYVKCLKFIIEAYQELDPMLPLVVNTMGFPEGVGVMLLIDTIHLVKPDIVVQIESFNKAANLPPVTHEFVALEEGWMCNKTPAKDPAQKIEETHQHELILLPTLVIQRRDFSFKLKPVDLRNLTLLSALSMNLERGMSLTSLSPYTIPYSQFGIHVCHHKLAVEEILTAIDASVVALCVTDLSKANRESDNLPLVFHEMPVCHCLGLGIIRGVDASRGLLYLVTTLPRVFLQKMNTILKGSLSLPDQMFLKQTSCGKMLPYVDALAPSTAMTPVRPRTRMPRSNPGANKWSDSQPIASQK